MPPAATNSGIVTDETSGERHIPESLRADGTTRKAIKIRPGYRPAEDVELYRPRNVVAQRERRRIGVPGAEAPKDEKPQVPGAPGAAKEPNRAASLSWRRDDGSSASAAPPSPSTLAAGNKNAKRREARKKARSTDLGEAAPLKEDGPPSKPVPSKAEEVDPKVEHEKKVRSLKKKLKQAKELKTRKDEGQGLLPEQIAKVIKINELIRELNALGIDDEGETKKDIGSVSDKAAT
ncbi:Exon junction complex, Pym [Cordyceps fumosorosea ARSEF 2679]|uniref:Exon junction complex, Pym n=1 Tax=Cordyceps fumosorosea (strain ARSEF 2679) TaxID=1081104 RepID=A0A167XE83_CORFA|nr:Exon junction complex, Pym [Cordyceps fumosorosea ARSEF 2679]OAA64868.1 Exon junction complex, Pym [Cordyceps fumosorosea ARSEF 2679]